MIGKKVYRSESDRLIAGVCGGLADYLEIDPVLIRLIWAGVTFFAGSGILLYILACIIIPNENDIAY